MLNNQQEIPNTTKPFILFLLEFRKRLLYCILFLIVVFLCLVAFANNIYHGLAIPLLRHLPENSNLIATQVAAPFVEPFKLTLAVSGFLAVPFFLYHLWAFVAPALYKREKHLILPLLVASSFLFYMGVAFAYFVVFPLVFKFFANITPQDVVFSPDISHYLSFCLKMFFAFGAAFEVPILTILLVKVNVVSIKRLVKMRPYIIVAAFVLGMLLTPPDVLSQILLAVPIWLLFETGLLVARMITRGEKD